MGVRIARATLADVKALRSVVGAAYAGYAAQGVMLPDVTNGLATDIQDGRVWAAFEGSHVVGALVLAFKEPDAHLQNVAVHPDHHGKGVGRALMDKAVSLSRQVGCKSLCLTTHRDITRNIEMYLHLRFDITGQDGTRIFMALALG